MKNNSGKENIKNIIILVLSIVIVGLIVFILLTSTAKKNNFLHDMLNLQANISYYLGQTKSDTFSAYENEQILTGNTDLGEIKNYNEEVLTPLVEKDSKIEKDGKVFYKLINDNVKEILKIDLAEYTDLEFYVQDGQYIRVKKNQTPSWWNKEYDSLCM